MISYDSGGKTVKILLMSLILILSVIIICAVVAQEEKTPGMVCGGLFAVLCLALGFYMNTF